MTTLKTLLPRRAMFPDESPAVDLSPEVDLPPGLHRFLKEWERQLLKSDKPPHREVDLPPHMYPHPELGCGCEFRFDDHRCGWPIS